MAIFTRHPSPPVKEELPGKFSCRRPDGTTYAVQTIGEYLTAIRELLHGEVHAIYRDGITVACARER
jgi:hypothetical protein